MHYIGVDIIEIDRVRQAIERWGDRFRHRIYTPAELELCGPKIPSLAARLAGKEAVAKTLRDTDGIGWKDIEVLADATGAPSVHLHGRAREQAECLGLTRLAISLAHSRDYAIAFVIGSTGGEATPGAP